MARRGVPAGDGRKLPIGPEVGNLVAMTLFGYSDTISEWP
jgi:hypothetical protein